MSYFNRTPNKNLSTISTTVDGVKEYAATTSIAALKLTTNLVGTDSVELMIVEKGENVTEIGWQLACEHADSYSQGEEPFFCSMCDLENADICCEECGGTCDENSEQYEGVEYVFYRWQLSVSGSYIGGGANDAAVIGALAEKGGIVKLDDTGEEWQFNIPALRVLVDLTVDEAKELVYLEEMIAASYPLKVVHYV